MSWVLDDPEQRKAKADDMVPARDMSLESLQAYEQDKKADHEDIGRYVAVNERLSIPELVKRLITYDKIDADKPDDQKLKIAKLKKRKDDPEFKDIYREAGYWTGWFMGDGDQVGDKLKKLAAKNPNNPKKQDQDLLRFSELMREWGHEFEERKDLFPGGKGRVIYAGGDDFMGVLYSEETQTKEKPEKLRPIEAWNWLLALPEQWKKLQNDLADELGFKDKNRFTYSVGFVWAGHQVPQRDILQHCREAEKRSKSLGRDRLTVRVVFNSGQYVQWTCPWDYLDILTKYRDRNGKTWGDPKLNWTHLYSDWAQLKARHAIPLQDPSDPVDDRIALAFFNLYFSAESAWKDNSKWQDHTLQQEAEWIVGKNSEKEILKWLDGLVNVGWQLCSNT